MIIGIIFSLFFLGLGFVLGVCEGYGQGYKQGQDDKI